MSNLLSYLRQEGLSATIKRAWNKMFFVDDSCTVFLSTKLDFPIISQNGACIEQLTIDNQTAFNRLKFWDFVKAEDYIDNPNQSVVLLKDGRNYVAYEAEQHEVKRIIHGLGAFKLNKGQGWIGPGYVAKDYRGKGYNKHLILAQMKKLQADGMYEVFTAINSKNEVPIKCMKSIGFVEIGRVNKQGELLADPEGLLEKHFLK